MPLHIRNTNDLDRANDIAARIREEWSDDPNIVNIAPGLKVIKGSVRKADELVLTFFVMDKLSSDEIKRRGLRHIPAEVEGIATDVEPIQVRPLSSPLPRRGERRDPLTGGLAIGNGNIQFSFGTLGGIVFDSVTGLEKGLTNEHVLVNTNEGTSGDPVIQPAPPRLQDYIDIDVVPKCCPIGPIWFIQTGGPASSLLAWVAVCAGAVALSDVRDPSRRGQDATIPVPNEQTTSEQVDVELEYPDFPIPGTPYKVDVNWKYNRLTTGATYTHKITETNINTHTLDLQQLFTDRGKYKRGDTVHLLAAIISPSKKPCKSFHTISYLIPTIQGQQNNSHMVVLHPVNDAELPPLERIFPQLKEPLQQHCDNFSQLQPDIELPSVYTHRDVRYENLDPSRNMRTVDWMPTLGISELSFSRIGIRIYPSFPAEYVVATVAHLSGEPVEVQAYNSNGSQVANAISPNAPATGYKLELKGQDIVELIVSGGGGEGVLSDICYGRKLITKPCFYYGRVVLSSFDPIGLWRTHLFVQTINDVREGTDSEEAAQTIGGLPVTQNFEYVGEGSNPPYGEGCIFRPYVDGNFEVVV